MAVNIVNAQVAPTSPLVVLQSPGGATGDSTFIIDFTPCKTVAQPSMRGRTVQLVNLGTAFTAISSLGTSIDGVIYEAPKTIQPATIGANTVEATVAVPATTSGTITTWVPGHDFRFLKIITTVGDATSGFLVNVGS